MIASKFSRVRVGAPFSPTGSSCPWRSINVLISISRAYYESISGWPTTGLSKRGG